MTTRPRRVQVLLAVCGPLAIVGFVSTVVVDALDSQSGRAAAHIGKEVLEAMPPFADLDSSRAVSLEARVVGVVATPAHRCPSLIFLRRGSVCSVPVFRAEFSLPAAATCRVATCQVVTDNERLRSAGAHATPYDECTASTFRSCDGRQSPEDLTGEIAGRGSVGSSHLATPLLAVGPHHRSALAACRAEASSGLFAEDTLTICGLADLYQFQLVIYGFMNGVSDALTKFIQGVGERVMACNRYLHVEIITQVAA